MKKTFSCFVCRPPPLCVDNRCNLISCFEIPCVSVLIRFWPSYVLGKVSLACSSSHAACNLPTALVLSLPNWCANNHDSIQHCGAACCAWDLHVYYADLTLTVMGIPDLFEVRSGCGSRDSSCLLFSFVAGKIIWWQLYCFTRPTWHQLNIHDMLRSPV